MNARQRRNKIKAITRVAYPRMADMMELAATLVETGDRDEAVKQLRECAQEIRNLMKPRRQP